MRTFSFLLVLLTSVFPQYLVGQSSNADEIYYDPDLSKTEKLKRMEALYADTDDHLEQVEIARLLSRLYYSTLQNKSVEKWVHKADSLASINQETGQDFDYDIMKVAWLNGIKKTATAISILEDMEADVRASGDSLQIMAWHIHMSRSYNNFDDKAEALKHLSLAQEMNNALKDPFHEGQVLRLKAGIAWEEKDLKKSLDYNQKAAEIFEELGSYGVLTAVYSDIIALYESMNDPSPSYIYRKKLSEAHKQEGCERCYFSNELNRCFYQIQQGRFESAKQLADSLITYAKSNNIDAAHATYLKGLCFRGLDDYPTAIKIINEAFEMSRKVRHNGKSQFYAHALYESYYWKDKFEPALEWFQVYSTFKDSVYNEKKATEIAVYEARLEALEEQRKVEELEAKIQINKQKKRLSYVLFGSVSLALIAGIYIVRSTAKIKEKEQQLTIEKLEFDQRLLEQKLDFKEKEVTSQLLNLAQKNKVLQDIQGQLEAIKSTTDNGKVTRLIRFVERSVSNNEQWQALLSSFQTIHASFYDKLKGLSDQLSSNDLRLASLIRLNMDSKEIGSLLNISDEGVKKARYRLRKKIGVDSDTNIHDFILNL
jgi:DNA-binding CsgD family transcriptional regulator